MMRLRLFLFRLAEFVSSHAENLTALKDYVKIFQNDCAL